MSDLDLRRLERRLAEGDRSAIPEIVRARRMLDGRRPSHRWLKLLPEGCGLEFELEWLSQSVSSQARAMLEAAGMSQAEAARRADISRWRVGQLVRRGVTTLGTWIAFCAVFGKIGDIKFVRLDEDPDAEDHVPKRRRARK